MDQPLKMLRYNTGTDKKAFVQFKQQFDVAIFNATIVAYSGASVADLISMHAHKYIIDPQTHIFQQEISAISSSQKNSGNPIKKSILKYLHELPAALSEIVEQKRRPLVVADFVGHLDALVQAVYTFETKYVSKYIEQKEYDKYLKFAGVKPEPKVIVAPYFMLKAGQPRQERKGWLDLNHEILEKTIKINRLTCSNIPVAAQLVLEKPVLLEQNIFNEIQKAYKIDGYDYIFIWIDDFDAFEARPEINNAFSRLVGLLNSMGKKPLMAYGGYESILLCAPNSFFKLYGVAQSVGYGEYRSITPVGGGMPINKYYFPPLHQRLKFDDVAIILSKHGYFDDSVSIKERTRRFYENICNCKTCREIVGNDVNNFVRFNDSTPYIVRTKNGQLEKNRATTDALLIAALHFLFCKSNEWESISTKDYSILKQELLNAFDTYMPSKKPYIETWCNIYGSEKD